MRSAGRGGEGREGEKGPGGDGSGAATGIRTRTARTEITLGWERLW